MIRLISTDFDGTIFWADNEPGITPEFLEKIQKLQTQNVKWVINTGRELSDLSQRLQVSCAPVLPDYIVTVERQIHIRGRHCYEEHTDWNASCHAEHETLFSQAGDLIHQIRGWIVKNFDAHLYAELWSPLCIIAKTEADADEIHNHTEARCREVPGLSIVRNGGYFRFSHDRFNKGTALAEVGRLMSLTRNEIFAAGDHFNDLPMLDGTHARWVAAPSNAIPEAKEIVEKAGGFVSNHPCSLGVLDALEHYQATARPE